MLANRVRANAKIVKRQPRRAGSLRGCRAPLLSVALAAALAGCGSSGSRSSGGTTAGGAESTGQSTSTSTARESTLTASSSTARESTLTAASATGANAASEAAARAISTPGCRHVPAPPSRAGEQAAKPTGVLNAAHTYTVRLQTNCGPIVIELAAREAPETTASFANLVKTGYYNGLTFHRIVPNFVIQGGDPNGNGSGGPSWQIVEAPPSNLHYTKGIVAMAKSASAAAGTSGSQFFIVTGSSVGLPPVYALVGHVLSGMKAVEAIAGVPTEAAAEGGEASRPRVPVVIEKATLSQR